LGDESAARMLKKRGEKLADGRWSSPPAERNKQPILDVLSRVLPARGLVLEIASGTGQHVVHFAAALPGLRWQPSDPDPELRRSIEARRAEAALPNLLPPVDLDVLGAAPWPISRADAVLCSNMIHVAPRAATGALLRGAARLLPPDGMLVLYGPYRRGGRHTSPGNEEFDRALRAENPEWGLRDAEAVVAEAAGEGLALREIVEMPANNLTLVLAMRRS
jgi:SAM-dependent methyltransferase